MTQPPTINPLALLSGASLGALLWFLILTVGYLVVAV